MKIRHFLLKKAIRSPTSFLLSPYNRSNPTLLASDRRSRKLLMSSEDHNKTITVLFSLVSIFPTLLICAAPWIIPHNISNTPSPRRDEQILIATAITVLFVFIAMWFWGTVLGLYMRKPWGRRLALCACLPLLFYCPPIAVYTWWFLHSAGGKQLYAVRPTQDFP